MTNPGTELSRREILAKAGRLTAGLAFLDLMAACAAQAQQHSTTNEDNGPRLGGPELTRPRPILFLSFDASSHSPIFAEMNADGHRPGKGTVWGAVWAPDGSMFAAPISEGAPPGLYLANPQTKEINKAYSTTAEERFAWTVAWSPDSRQLAAILSNAGSPALQTSGEVSYTLLIVDAVRGKQVGRHPLPNGVLLDIPLSPPNKFRWSPDGSKILISWEHAVVVHVATGAVERISEANVVAEWAPDGRGVYYVEVAHCCDPGKRTLGGCYLRQLFGDRIQLTNAKDIARLGYKIGLSRGFSALSPSGSRFVFDDAASQGSKDLLGLYEIGDGRKLDLASPTRVYKSDESVVQLDWSPDETLIAALTVGEDWRFFHLRTLELATGTWKNLATVDLSPLGAADVTENIDFLGSNKNLSWTQ